MTADPKPDKEPPLPKAAKKPLRLWAALAIALGLIVLPTGIVGPLFAPFIILWAGCALALSFNRQFAPIRKQRLRNLAGHRVGHGNDLVEIYYAEIGGGKEIEQRGLEWWIGRVSLNIEWKIGGDQLS